MQTRIPRFFAAMMALSVTAAVLAAGPLGDLLAGAPKVASKLALQLEGKVVHVEDGDTVTLLVDGSKQVTVRLWGVDAPETCHGKVEGAVCRTGQNYGDRARQQLRSLALGQQLIARCEQKTSYSRRVCELQDSRGRSLNLELVAAGAAWVEPRYNTRAEYREAQARAQAGRRGLWGTLEAPMEPRIWRAECEGRKSERPAACSKA